MLEAKQIVISQSAIRKVGGREAHKEADRVRKGNSVKSRLLSVMIEASKIILL